MAIQRITDQTISSNLLEIGDDLEFLTKFNSFLSKYDLIFPQKNQQILDFPEWAERAEDSLIPTSNGGDEVDDYSAKHFAEKADASKETARTTAGWPVPPTTKKILTTSGTVVSWIDPIYYGYYSATVTVDDTRFDPDNGKYQKIKITSKIKMLFPNDTDSNWKGGASIFVKVDETSTFDLYLKESDYNIHSFAPGEKFKLFFDGAVWHLGLSDLENNNVGFVYDEQSSGVIEAGGVDLKKSTKKLSSTALISLYDLVGGGDISAEIITLSGTTWTLNNTDYDSTFNSNTYEFVALSSTLALMVFDNGSNDAVIACSISGTVVTWGTEVSLNRDSLDQNDLILIKIDSTKFVAVRSVLNGSAVDELRVVCGTISGTTITLGTEIVLQTSGSGGTDFTNVSAIALSTSKFIVSFYDVNSPNDSKYYVCTISGTTITAGSVATNSGTEISQPSAMMAVSATECTIVSVDGVKPYAMHISGMSGTTPTFNSPVYLDNKIGENIENIKLADMDDAGKYILAFKSPLDNDARICFLGKNSSDYFVGLPTPCGVNNDLDIDIENLGSNRFTLTGYLAGDDYRVTLFDALK